MGHVFVVKLPSSCHQLDSVAFPMVFARTHVDLTRICLLAASLKALFHRSSIRSLPSTKTDSVSHFSDAGNISLHNSIAIFILAYCAANSDTFSRMHCKE